MTQTTTWRPVRRYPGLYASEAGELKHDRLVLGTWINADGYRLVRIDRHRLEYVHRLVAEAFLDVRPGQLVLHSDDDKANNSVANLKIGTHRENRLDSVRNNTHQWSRRTECAHGHPFDQANTYWDGGRRRCRACQRVLQANRRRNAKAHR